MGKHGKYSYRLWEINYIGHGETWVNYDREQIYHRSQGMNIGHEKYTGDRNASTGHLNV